MSLFQRIIKGNSGREGIVENEVQTPLGQVLGTFRVVDIYNIAGVGVIPVGEVMSGQIAPGMKATLNGKVVEIKTIEANHQQLSVANVGAKVGFSLKGANKNDLQKEQIIEFSK